MTGKKKVEKFRNIWQAKNKNKKIKKGKARRRERYFNLFVIYIHFFFIFLSEWKSGKKRKKYR